VRQLKAEKAEKAKIDSEVAVLLSMKKQLAIAEGTPAAEAAAQTTSKKSRKEKKTA
jgi:histidyl-tRNA synthetase